MQDYNEPFGDWLRRRIYARGMNLRQAARTIGTSGATMSHWVNGTRMPNPEYAQKLATLLLVSEEEMYVRTGHRKPRDTDQHPLRAELVRMAHDLPLSEAELVLGFMRWRSEESLRQPGATSKRHPA